MIIGIVGTMGSGKGVFSRYLKEKGFSYITLSDIVREEATERSLEIGRKVLQDLGNLMREKSGNGYWAKKALEKIDNGNWIIDGVRNLGEIKELRDVKGVLIGIDAPVDLRLERLEKRDKMKDEGRTSSDPKDNKEVRKLELRDRGLKEPEHGQQVLKCLELVDYRIMNDSSLEDFYLKIDSVLDKIKE